MTGDPARTGRGVVSGRPWWAFDRTRWTRPAIGAGVLALAGVVDITVGSGLGAELGAEATFGGALALGLGTTVALRRSWRGRSDDDVDTYTSGVETIMIGVGAGPSSPALARFEQGDTTLATLHQQAADGSDPRERTVRVRTGTRTLTLQHRRGHPDDTDHGDQQPPDMVLRLVDADGLPHAGAHVHRCEDLEDWTVPADGHVLRFRARTGRRPRRRTLVDTATGGAYLLRLDVRPRHRVLTLTASPDLTPATVTLCLWLAHLLDTHAQLTHPGWHAPDRDWTTVPDDFPSFLGPGGFGDPYARPVPGGGSPGGGTS